MREIIEHPMKEEMAGHSIFPAHRKTHDPRPFRATHMPRHVQKERPHRDFLQIADYSARELDKLFSLPGGIIRDLKRSEEHTSELQSLTNLVCRLLLEKKKKC